MASNPILEGMDLSDVVRLDPTAPEFTMWPSDVELQSFCEAMPPLDFLNPQTLDLDMSNTVSPQQAQIYALQQELNQTKGDLFQELNAVREDLNQTKNDLLEAKKAADNIRKEVDLIFEWVHSVSDWALGLKEFVVQIVSDTIKAEQSRNSEAGTTKVLALS